MSKDLFLEEDVLYRRISLMQW